MAIYVIGSRQPYLLCWPQGGSSGALLVFVQYKLFQLAYSNALKQSIFIWTLFNSSLNRLNWQRHCRLQGYFLQWNNLGAISTGNFYADEMSYLHCIWPMMKIAKQQILRCCMNELNGGSFGWCIDGTIMVHHGCKHDRLLSRTTFKCVNYNTVFLWQGQLLQNPNNKYPITWSWWWYIISGVFFVSQKSTGLCDISPRHI